MTGTYGVSFLIVMVNQALSETVSRIFGSSRATGHGMATPTKQPVWGFSSITVALLVALALGYGWLRLAEDGVSRTLRVAIIQANRMPYDNMPARQQLQYLSLYRQLSLEAARSRPALIVWPASSLPAPITSRIVSRALPQLAHATEAYLLVGGAGHEKDRPRQDGDLPYSNSEFLVSPTGRIEGQYNKIRLLPFNEYLPLKDVIPWPRWITTLRAGFIPGEEYTLFRVSGTAFGAPICWENLFPDLFRSSSGKAPNSWSAPPTRVSSGTTAQPYQTLAMNVFRAVENRVAVVRAATTGVSAFIDPDGGIAAKVQDASGQDLFLAGYLVREIPLSSRKTFYTRYGDVFAVSATVLALFISAFALLPATSPGTGE